MDEKDLSEYAGDTVRLTATVKRIISDVEIVEGEASGTGKTVAVPRPSAQDEDPTYRLDMATLLAGETEIRDSWVFRLYTPETFRRQQQMNKASGPRRGVDAVSDADALPSVTHQPAD